MRHVLLLIILGLALAACGGDALDEAANCTELGVAVDKMGAMSDADMERIGEKLVSLYGSATANNAWLELAVCEEVVDRVAAAHVEQTFTSIADALNDE